MTLYTNLRCVALYRVEYLREMIHATFVLYVAVTYTQAKTVFIRNRLKSFVGQRVCECVCVCELTNKTHSDKGNHCSPWAFIVLN